MTLPTMVSLVVVSVVVVAASILFVIRRRYRKQFEERFPAISDAEFVARCSPGTNPEVALKVRRIIADALGVEYERVHPSARLMEDLGAG